MIILIKKLSIILIIFLTSCTSTTFASQVLLGIKNEFFYKYDTNEKAIYDDTEFSFILASFGKRVPAKLILANVVDGQYQWVSEDNISIYTTRNGKVIKTNNLFSNMVLHSADFESHNKFKDNLYFIDLYNPDAFGISASSTYSTKGTKSFRRFGKDISAENIEETVYIKLFGKKYRNTYLLTNEQVIYTEQTIHPRLDELNIRFFYK